MPDLRLSAEDSALVIVDFQDKLARAMPDDDRERAERAIVALLEGARRLGLPVLATEQYPKGLGPTVAPLREALEAFEPRVPVLEKMELDACANEGFARALDGLDRSTVIAAGMEAHVCVWQTVRSLCARGRTVHVPVDATCSRRPEHRRIAEGLWRRAGAMPTTSETVLFDLLVRAGGDDFKAISRLVK